MLSSDISTSTFNLSPATTTPAPDISGSNATKPTPNVSGSEGTTYRTNFTKLVHRCCFALNETSVMCHTCTAIVAFCVSKESVHYLLHIVYKTWQAKMIQHRTYYKTIGQIYCMPMTLFAIFNLASPKQNVLHEHIVSNKIGIKALGKFCYVYYSLCTFITVQQSSDSAFVASITSITAIILAAAVITGVTLCIMLMWKRNTTKVERIGMFM